MSEIDDKAGGEYTRTTYDLDQSEADIRKQAKEAGQSARTIDWLLEQKAARSARKPPQGHALT